MDWENVEKLLRELADQIRRGSPFQADCLLSLADLSKARDNRAQLEVLVIYLVDQVHRDISAERIRPKNREALDALLPKLGLLRQTFRTEVQDIFGDEDKTGKEKDPPIDLTAYHPLCTEEEMEEYWNQKDHPGFD